MNKEETLALWAQGKDAWNAWAQGMLERRAEMEKAGTWATAADIFDSELLRNETTGEWRREAAVDFSDHQLDGSLDFSGRLFPGHTNFGHATFERDVTFNECVFIGPASFEGATFKKMASFDDSRFSGFALFRWANLSGEAGFFRVIFTGTAIFNGTAFGRIASFDSTEFGSDAKFGGATFYATVGFDSAKFSRIVSFRSVQFKKSAVFANAAFSDYVDFSENCFEGYTNFRKATFKGVANFAAAQSASSFTLAGAQFGEVPDFVQAHFKEAPSLDDVQIRPGQPGADRAARYRALKRLAIQGHDHAREQEYFAGELKALRGHPDRLLPNPLNWFRKDKDGRRRPVWPGGARYWFGLGYQWFSDFGRSMVRPLGWWGLALIGCTTAYLQQHCARATTGGCLVGDGDPLSAAFGLSIRKALPFAGVGSSEKLNQIHACLYGVHGAALKGSPVIPDAVYYLGIVQLLFSLLLLFLFLLAVRNHFRIK